MKSMLVQAVSWRRLSPGVQFIRASQEMFDSWLAHRGSNQAAKWCSHKQAAWPKLISSLLLCAW